MSPKTRVKKKVPFEFVLDQLFDLDPVVKPMFGCFAVYVGGRIVLALRDRSDHTGDNGVWLATTHEHHESLRKIFPSMRSIALLGKGETGWQNLPSSEYDFEGSVTKACELIRRRDPRIGKVPKSRSRRKPVARKRSGRF